MQEWVRKAPLDFHALLNEPGDARVYASIGAPVTLMFGTRTNPQTLRIAELLGKEIPGCQERSVDGASHMGPFSHREDVLRIVMDHLASVSNGGRAAIDSGN